MPPRITWEDVRKLQLLIEHQQTVNEAQAIQLAKFDTKFEEQHRMMQQQGNTLDQILYLIKGSEALTIEGIIPAQKRMQDEIQSLVNLKKEITIYMGLFFSKRLWRITLYVGIIIFIGYLAAKFGWDVALEWLKKIIP